jgi:hypothetical protein
MAARRRVVLGLHGRTAVALTGVGDDLGVVVRADVRTRESQPFHDAEGLPLDQAEALIASALDAAIDRAAGDLAPIVEQVAAAGLELAGAVVATKVYRLPATLEAILRSHASCHGAEGQMTGDALVAACERLGLAVTMTPDLDIDPKVEPVGKVLGPPWRKEHKIAATAALRALDAASS